MVGARANPFRRCQVTRRGRVLYEVAIKPVARAVACGCKNLFDGKSIQAPPVISNLILRRVQGDKR
jgi:hypothetical protein